MVFVWGLQLELLNCLPHVNNVGNFQRYVDNVNNCKISYSSKIMCIGIFLRITIRVIQLFVSCKECKLLNF